ncbi:hypothetical protein [Clostridium butyricum]|uniref:hypothetical protein n=1 Tax=Clostridium butyricum TaxID=1492 RepID=UPI00374EEDD0
MNNTSIFNGSVLYYPSIEFENEFAIKSALCIWDTIYRIVPETYIPNDSSEIKTAIQEGAIKNIVLNKQDLEMASEGFLDFMENIPFIPAGMDGYDVINLHRDKVDGRLYPYLLELSKKVTGDWITLSEQIVHGYMLFLANSVCRNRKISKITDNPDVFSIMGYFENDGQFDEFIYNPNAQEYYTNLVVSTLVPAGVERTDINILLKFREKTSRLRSEFRNTVCSFTDEIKDINDKEYAQDLIKKLKKDLDYSKEGLIEQSFSFIKNLVPSLISVGIPTTLTAFGTLGSQGDLFSKKTIMESCSIGAIAAISDGISKCKGWSSDTASYYVGMRSTFEDGFLRYYEPRFDRIFEEFMND